MTGCRAFSWLIYLGYLPVSGSLVVFLLSLAPRLPYLPAFGSPGPPSSVFGTLTAPSPAPLLLSSVPWLPHPRLLGFLICSISPSSAPPVLFFCLRYLDCPVSPSSVPQLSSFCLRPSSSASVHLRIERWRQLRRMATPRTAQRSQTEKPSPNHHTENRSA